MPLLATGSSGYSVPRAKITPEVADKLLALGADEPLPHNYRRDRIRLLAQSPRRAYTYWDFNRDPFESLRMSFGPRANDFVLVVRLIDTGSNNAIVHEATVARNSWFNCLPDHNYRAEVGFVSRTGLFLRLLSSAEVRTPRGRVSSHSDEAAMFRAPSDEFARVLEQTGFLTDALEVSLEAADEASEDSASRRVARQLGNADLPDLSAPEQTELRGLLAAMAMGTRIDGYEGELSEALRRWLAVLEQLGADLSQEHILAILKYLLGIETSGIPLSPLPQLIGQAVLGASEVNLPSPPIRMWMPSMTASRLGI